MFISEQSRLPKVNLNYREKSVQDLSIHFDTRSKHTYIHTYRTRILHIILNKYHPTNIILLEEKTRCKIILRHNNGNEWHLEHSEETSKFDWLKKFATERGLLIVGMSSVQLGYSRRLQVLQ